MQRIYLNKLTSSRCYDLLDQISSEDESERDISDVEKEDFVQQVLLDVDTHEEPPQSNSEPKPDV